MSVPLMEITREELIARHGFRAPEAWALLINLARASEVAGELGEFCRALGLASLVDSEIPLSRTTDAFLYQNTPPEYFEIGSVGVDGASVGYIVHAPELEADDWPMGDFSPMDSGGVALLGVNTPRAIEALISEAWAFAIECDEPFPVEMASRLADVFGIRPDPSKAEERFTADGGGVPIVPRVPDGWRFEPSADGVGVLARAELFGEIGTLDSASFRVAADLLTIAEEQMKRACPAGALLLAREHDWMHGDADGRCTVVMASAYEKLGRGGLAERVKRRCPRITSRVKSAEQPPEMT